MPKNLSNLCADYIASKTDIRPENVMIMATHTHSGPPSDLTAPKAKEYLTRAAGAVMEANANLRPQSYQRAAVLKAGYHITAG